jgi:GMP synthase (glutamine-hydrolysing)
MQRTLVILKTGSTFPDLVEQHGDFEDWVAEGLALANESVSVFDAQGPNPLPNPDALAAVVVTGAHDMVTEHALWSETASAWLRELVGRQVPTLGICYGHQLLAHALGGEVGYHPRGSEVGTVSVTLLPAGRKDALLGAMPRTFPAYATHAQSVLELPSGAVRLAESEFERNHAFRVGECVWGVQFHPEFSEPVIRHYVDRQRDLLAKQGQTAEQLIEAIEPSPAGRILQQFGQLFEKRFAPAKRSQAHTGSHGPL